MSSSRLFSLFRPSLLHHCPILSPPILKIPQTLRFNAAYRSAAAAVNDFPETRTASGSPNHPWPEWVAFVDGLKAKGYFAGDSSPVLPDDVVVYKEMNLVKDAALSFARDRYDVFR